MPPTPLSRWKLPLCWVASCWALFAWAAGLEWANNPQYGFGWFTLPLALGALFRRWRDRPEPGLSAGGSPVWAAFVFFLPVVWVLHLAGPEWRPPVWLLGASALWVSLWVTARMGGGSWVRHFAPAWCLALLGLPWPTQWENGLMGGLTSLVSSFTADALNATGVLAVQEGQLLRLTGGRLIGIEEACSGLQGLTAALALGLALGEIFRLRGWQRAVLPLAGAGGAFVSNLLRSYLLCRGEAFSEGFVERWHDTAGTAVSVVSLVLVVFLADRFRSPQVSPDQQLSRHPHGPGPSPAWGLGFLVAISCPLLGEGWFRLHGDSGAASHRPLRLAFEASLPLGAQPFPLPERTQALLRCEGSHNARWLQRDAAWQVQWLEWGEGRVSSFAGVHRPEVCLPAAGLERVGDLPELRAGSPGRTLALRGHLFRQAGRTLVVYHGVWGADGESMDELTETAGQRLAAAWAGKRRPAQAALYIAVAGLAPAAAEVRARAWLEKALAAGVAGP